MFRPFLKASVIGGDGQPAVAYEAATDGTTVRETPPTLPDEIRKSIVLLEFFNHTDATMVPVFWTRILRGSLEKPGGSKKLWEDLTYAVRCYFAEPGKENHAPVDLQLALATGRIQVKEFEVFGQDPVGKLPVDLARISSIEFSGKSFSRSGTPPLLAKLGLTIEPNASSQAWQIRTTLVAGSPHADSGFKFTVPFPLEESARQRLEAFKTSIDPALIKNDPFGCRATIIQRPPEAITNIDPPQAEPGDREHVIIEIRTIPAQSVMASWNAEVARPYLASLESVRAGLPLSFLPTFDVRNEPHATSFWRCTFSLVDQHRTALNLAATDFRLRDCNSALPRQRVSIVARTLEPFDPTSESSDGGQDAEVRFLNVSLVALIQNASVLRASLHLRRRMESGTSSDESSPASARAGIVFESVEVAGKVGEQKVRTGALDLVFGGATGETEQPRESLIHVSFRPATLSSDGDEKPDLIRVDQCELRLNVLSIAPGSQDDVPGEEFAREQETFERRFAAPAGVATPTPTREGELKNEAAYQRRFQRTVPHLLSLRPALTPLKPFQLNVLERAFERRSHTLSLQLQQQTLAFKEGNGNVSLIAIDEHPFLVAQVNVPEFLSDLGSGITNEIANWTNRATEPGWELLGGAHGFELVLPPGAIGETMQRLRGDNDVIAEKRGVDFRFSPPTRARVFSSPNAQRFVEAAWNLRRVLGYPGQRDPGSAVHTLDFEILYGIKGRLKNRFVRVAEIGARLGALPGAQVPDVRWQHDDIQETAFRFARDQWSLLYPVLLSRLGILELRDQREPDRFRMTEVDGLEFDLRERGKSELAYPINGQQPSNERIPIGPLKASYAWAHESERLYEALWRDPHATSGEVSGLYFSALGAWGHQVARFDNDRARVISTVRMGRLESLAVERIGVVGIFRHKAKHVIVYKRTVTPGEQFADDQEQFPGVPLLRKFEEYVELLEPIRHFGTGELSADRAAFVRAYQFLSGEPPRIRVDSRWGEDIGTFGWRIPLWKPTAKRSIYPKPHSCFWMDSDKPGEGGQQRNDEPHKLYFYTTVDPNLGADTETWPMADGVDYRTIFKRDKKRNPIRGTDAGQAAKISSGASGDVNKFKDESDPERTYEPGLGQFTFAIAPSRTPVNVVADRVEGTVSAALHTVTMMRGLREVADLGESKFAQGQDLLTEVRDHMGNALRPVLAQIPDSRDFATIANDWDRLQKNAKKVLEEFNPALDQLAALVGTGTKPICDAFQQRLRNQLSMSRAQITLELEARLRTLVDDVDRAARLAGDDLATVREKAKAKVDEYFQRVLLTIQFGKTGLDNLSKEAHKTATGVVTDLTNTLSAAADLIKQLDQAGQLTRDRAKQEIRALSSKLAKLLDDADKLMERAAGSWAGNQLDQVRSSVQRAKAELELATADTIKKLDDSTVSDFLKACLDGIAAVQARVDVLKSRLDAAKAALDQAVTNYSTDLEKRLGELQKRINGSIDTATDFDHLRTLVVKNFTDVIVTIESAVDTHLKSLSDVIEAQALSLCQKLLAPFDDLLAMLRAAWNEHTLDAIFIGVRDLKLPGGDARKTIEQFLHAREQDLNAFLAEASRQIQPTADDLKKLAEIATDAALQLLRAFGDKPKVPQLDVNLPRIAFRFAEFDGSGLLLQLPEVNVTPLIAKANELAGVLNPIALKIPSIKLGEKFLPFRMEDFDLAKAFPNFGGIDLSNLFKRVRLPSLANDHVKVTHGFDVQRQSGWVQIDVDVPFGGQPAEVFSIFGVTITLLKGRFVGVGRIEGAVGEAPRRVFRGSVSGDWEVKVGGTALVLLRDCTLTFDDGGNIGFSVTPDRIQLQAVLKFLADILSRFKYNSKGFSVTLTPEGLLTALDLPLPNVQAGTFGIANLSLSFFFGLRVSPFELQVGVGVARRLRPFTLTVFVLGGAGFFTLTLAYQPGTKLMTTRVEIGIYASASLAISLGPISGGIYAYFGVNVEYLAESGRGSEMRVAIVILFIGEVTLLGFISVSLSVGLQAEYRSSGGLVGRGFVSYSIKIGPFFEINVSCAIEYHYGNPGALTSTANDYRAVARRYLDMFSN